MSGLRYILVAAALFVGALLLSPRGDALVSPTMLHMVSAVQQACNARSRTIAGVEVGCRSFADVRKIEMREDNRNRSTAGSHIVQIGH